MLAKLNGAGFVIFHGRMREGSRSVGREKGREKITFKVKHCPRVQEEQNKEGQNKETEGQTAGSLDQKRGKKKK